MVTDVSVLHTVTHTLCYPLLMAFITINLDASMCDQVLALAFTVYKTVVVKLANSESLRTAFSDHGLSEQGLKCLR